MSEQLDQILAKSKNTTFNQANQVPASCQKPTRDLTEVIEGLSLPSFEPVCPFSMVQSHNGEQEEVDPEAEEEATILPAKVVKKKTEKKVMILSPIQEEGVTGNQVDKKIYKAVFKKCHADLKLAKIGTETKGDFIKSNKVLNSQLKNLMIEKYQLRA